MATTALTLPEQEYMLSGNRACAGCSLGIAFRHISKALAGKCIFVVPASCFTVLGGMYPTSSVTVPFMNCVFPSTAASATGVAAGLRAIGREDITVVAMAGDGGTADIGIQALSGAAERNVNILYICYDNEGYMNTGTQRSGSTPMGARTTTTPTLGKRQFPKDVPAILEAHSIPYIATASPSYPGDLYDKVRKAREIYGTRYLHLNAPCPSGWQFPARDTIEFGRLGVETGMFLLYEIENGVLRLTSRSKSLAQQQGELKPVREFLGSQGRFRAIDDETVEAVQQWVNDRWKKALARHKEAEAAGKAE